jgi:hypothetical protein
MTWRYRKDFPRMPLSEAARRAAAQREAREEIDRYVHLRSWGPILWSLPVFWLVDRVFAHLGISKDRTTRLTIAIAIPLSIVVSEVARAIYIRRLHRTANSQRLTKR